MLKNYLSSFIFIFFLPLTVMGDVVGYKGNPHKAIVEYNKLHRQFFAKMCGAGEDREYFKLLKNYRGKGFYLPTYKDHIDKKAISSNMNTLRKKKIYIKSLLDKVQKNDFPKYSYISLALNESLEKLLQYKKEYHLELLEVNREKIKKKSEKELVAFKNKLNLFFDQIYFLKSFNFPNDFMKYRREYEEAKNDNDKKDSNKIYFFRKIVEDGAYDSNHSWPDKFLRTTLDTVHLSIQKDDVFLSENVRYDIDWILSGVERILNRGKKKQIERLSEWYSRTDEAISFYEEIIKEKNKKKADALVATENEATEKLNKFVYQKQADVYEFWSKQSELNRALFSLETILYNEVGVVDGPHGLERFEVAQVVIKRFYDDFYNQLAPKQKLMTYLNDKIEHKKFKWLNTLFRVGEFSFTYHYISAVSHIFCPDMSSRGKRIRYQNLKISLNALKEYSKDFEAIRYFSRTSMLGKIDMSSVWTDYKKLPEKVGLMADAQRRLARYYLADKYRYLYSFLDDKNVEYSVLEIEGKKYSQRWIKGKPAFFDYRSPHLFSYFKRID